jgi:hypothetical protein
LGKAATITSASSHPSRRITQPPISSQKRERFADQFIPAAIRGGFVLPAALFGGSVTIDVAISIVLIVAGIFVTLRR